MLCLAVRAFFVLNKPGKGQHILKCIQFLHVLFVLCHTGFTSSVCRCKRVLKFVPHLLWLPLVFLLLRLCSSYHHLPGTTVLQVWNCWLTSNIWSTSVLNFTCLAYYIVYKNDLTKVSYFSKSVTIHHFRTTTNCHVHLTSLLICHALL